MAGLVPELRNAAANNDVDLLSLIRKVLAASTLLNVQSTKKWAEYELKDYPKACSSKPQVDLPDYRIITGEIQCQQPSGQLQPSVIDQARLPQKLIRYELRVGLEWLWTRIREEDKPLTVPFNGEHCAKLKLAMGNRGGEPVLVLSKVDILTMFEKIRTAVLNWAIELEGQHIIGENMSFNDKEKNAAVNVSIQSNSNNNSGNTTIGNITDSPVMINSEGGSQVVTTTQLNSPELATFIKELKAALPELNLSEDTRQEIDAEIATVEVQLASPKPKHTIMKESLTTIRDILVGITGSVLATGLLQGVTTFL